jgi:glycosyltransferase involved in cell wall biosynthesis
MAKISIIIPVYNSESYIEKCLSSLIDQTFSDFEIICIDDGSIDNSRDIIDNFMELDKRIKVICQSNLYAGVARNNGLKYASGEYVIFLDADDFFDKNMLSTVVSKADSEESDIVIFSARYYDNQTGKISEPDWLIKKALVPKKTPFSYEDVKDYIFNLTTPVPWNKLYRRSFIDESKLQFQATKRSNDEYFVNISLVLARKISVINERFVYYRVNNATSLQSFSQDDRVDEYDFYTALKTIKNELYRIGIYYVVERSFINKCLSTCVSALSKRKTVGEFIDLYNFLKEVAFKELNIAGQQDNYFYSNGNKYLDIMTKDPVDYLFQMYKSAQTAGSKAEKYYCPFYLLEDKREIILYGAGNVGKAYYRQIIGEEYYKLVLWVDKNYKNYQAKGLPVYQPQRIMDIKNTPIIVAVEREDIYKQISKELIDIGVDEAYIVWDASIKL